MPVVTVC